MSKNPIPFRVSQMNSEVRRAPEGGASRIIDQDRRNEVAARMREIGLDEAICRAMQATGLLASKEHYHELPKEQRDEWEAAIAEAEADIAAENKTP